MTHDLGRRALERWQHDPALFAREVLGVTFWRGQREIVEAILTSTRVAVRSGHKCGKSTALACLSLWWITTRRRARVILTAPSTRQVESILWAEITRVYRASRFPIGGELHKGAEAGLKLPDGREIVGFSTDDTERMAGFSGPNMLFLVDEASGVTEPIFRAIRGNRAGGARIVMTGNPTQLSGEFYESFQRPRPGLTCIHLTSIQAAEEAPREIGLRAYGESGLALADYAAEVLDDCGGNVDDPEYRIRVLGEFPLGGIRNTIPVAAIEAARARTPIADGPLVVAVDVARFGDDKSVVAGRRGTHTYPLRVFAGFDTVQVAGETLRFIDEHIGPNELVEVRVDTSNNGGVADILRRHEHLRVVDVVASAHATRPGFARLRDQIWWEAREWLFKRGALPDDGELIVDLKAPTYDYDETGARKVESKKLMKRRLNRSPDRGDAFCMLVWESGSGATAAAVVREYEQAVESESDDDE